MLFAPNIHFHNIHKYGDDTIRQKQSRYEILFRALQQFRRDCS